MTAPSSTARNIAAFITVSLIWGSTWLVIKDQISAIPPGWTVTWRFTGAAVGMCLLTLVRGESLRMPREGVRLAAVIGLLQFCGNFQLVYRAEHYVASGLVAVLYALLMVPNALLARVMLGTRLQARFLIGSGVAMGGIALLMMHEYRGGQGDVVTGVLFTLGGILCASASNVLQATETGRRQAVVPLITWAMIFGAVIDAGLAYGMYGAPVLDPHPRYWAGVAYLAIAGSVITFPVYFALIRAIGPGRAAYSNVVVPVVAMALSTLFEGYRWTGLAVAGSVVVMAGLLIALSGRASVAKPARNDG